MKDLDPGYCKEDDEILERLTSLRFIAMGSILLFKILKMQRRAEAEKEKKPYNLHPNMTDDIIKGGPYGFFMTGCLFIQSEGVGLAIYFSVSALMDNYAIYFVTNTGFCEYIVQVSLYSMAIVTFLPTCIVAYYKQDAWYSKGQWFGMKAAFILLMVVTTAISFAVRLYLVYKVGWAYWVDHKFEMMFSKHDKSSMHPAAIFAVLTPPFVDVVQTLTLLKASGHIKTSFDDPKSEYLPAGPE